MLVPCRVRWRIQGLSMMHARCCSNMCGYSLHATCAQQLSSSTSLLWRLGPYGCIHSWPFPSCCSDEHRHPEESVALPQPTLSCGHCTAVVLFSAGLCRSGLYPLQLLASDSFQVHCVAFKCSMKALCKI